MTILDFLTRQRKRRGWFSVFQNKGRWLNDVGVSGRPSAGEDARTGKVRLTHAPPKVGVTVRRLEAFAQFRSGCTGIVDEGLVQVWRSISEANWESWLDIVPTRLDAANHVLHPLCCRTNRLPLPWNVLADLMCKERPFELAQTTLIRCHGPFDPLRPLVSQIECHVRWCSGSKPDLEGAFLDARSHCVPRHYFR